MKINDAYYPSAQEIKQQFDDYFKDQFGVDCLQSSDKNRIPLLHKLKLAQTVIIGNAELIELELENKVFTRSKILEPLKLIKNALRHIQEK